MPEPSDLTGAMPASPLDAAASLRVLCHDLRQPLVVAMGYVSMLEDGSFGELPPEVAGVLVTISGRLDAMNAIIDQLEETAQNGSSAPA